MAGYRSSFAPDRCAKRAAARIPAASSGEGPPAVVAAVIGGGDGFDLHRCRGVEHEVHDLPAYSFPKYGGSLAHEFNNSFLSGSVEAGDCPRTLNGLLGPAALHLLNSGWQSVRKRKS